jgi:hypothetical protein
MLNSFQTSGNSPGEAAQCRRWHKPICPQRFQPIFSFAGVIIPLASFGFFNIDSVIVQFPEAV